MKLHKLMHARSRQFKCKECDKAFARKGQLSQHMLIHTKERLFSCQVCDKEFRLSGHLKRHNLIHSGDKPFVCHICETVFAHASTLKSHIRIHTNDKPVCVESNKRFRRSSELTVNRRHHSGERPFDFVVCDRAFISSRHLSQHM